MILKASKPILYLITRGATSETSTPSSAEFQAILKQVTAAVAAGIQLIQIREKTLTAQVLFELAVAAVAIARNTNTQILINDRADIAAGSGAAGVHLTSQSIAPAVVRKTFGPDFLIGVSTHSLIEARTAHEAGADFAVFGPVFATPSKAQYGSPLGLGNLSAAASELKGFPLLALGGVTLDNLSQCFSAGAAGLAGITLFEDAPGLASLVARIEELGQEKSN